MTDQTLDIVRFKATSALNIPQVSGAKRFRASTQPANRKRSSFRFDHQAAAEDIQYTSLEVTAESNTYRDQLQDASVSDLTPILWCEFKLPQTDAHVLDAYLEMQVQIGALSSTTPAFLPAPLWIHSITFDYGNQTPFQRLYGDLIWRRMLLSVPPEKLFFYSYNTFNWLNPPNMPGLTHTQVGITATQFSTGTTLADVVYQNANQLLTAACSSGAIYPWQPKTGVSGAISLAAKVVTVRIPLIGSFFQQAGIFNLSWITSDRLTMRVFGRGSPVYNTSISSGDRLSVASASQMALRMICASFPPGSHDDAVFKSNNLEIQILDHNVERIAVASSDLTAGKQFTLRPTSLVNRWLSAVDIVFKKESATSNGIGYHLDPTGGSNAPTATLVDQNCDTALGSNFRSSTSTTSTTSPTLNLRLTGGESVFGGSKAEPSDIDMMKLWLPFKNYPSNPYTMGLVPGQKSYAPLWWSDVPMHFGSQVHAINGVNKGCLMLPENVQFEFTCGDTAPTFVSDYVYFYSTYWKTIRIANGRIEEIPYGPLQNRIFDA